MQVLTFCFQLKPFPAMYKSIRLNISPIVE
jgi:hypothetical protein